MSLSQVVWLNGTVYVGGGYTSGTLRDHARLYSFRPGVESIWKITDSPTYWYALTMYESQLLLVGGYEYSSGEITNKIFTLRNGQFVEILPPMREKRQSPSVVSSGPVLIIAGGMNTELELSSVEVLRDGLWTIAPSIPSEGCNMVSTLHGDQWYLVQANGNVYRASLESLVFESGQSPWELLPDIPNRDSAVVFFGGHLLSIGGEGNFSATSEISALCSRYQVWKHVADLPVALSYPSAAVLPSGELIVLGGDDIDWNRSCKVFVTFIKGLFY